MTRKLVSLVITLALIFLFVSGCAKQDTALPGNGNGQDEPSLSAEAEAWVQDSKSMFLAQAREIDGILYLLVTYGEQPTGGYAVEITDTIVETDKIIVTVNFTRPAPEAPVTQAITFPYDLKTLDVTNLPVEFVPAGDEEYIPVLMGIDEMRPIAAQSGGIKVFGPAPGDSVPRQFAVEGIANVFEGNVQYRLLDAAGEPLLIGFTTATMGDWGYFMVKFETIETVPDGKALTLELFTASAKDGSIQNMVQIELLLE